MLQKVILKPIKVLITCKILGPYLYNNWRYSGVRRTAYGVRRLLPISYLSCYLPNFDQTLKVDSWDNL